MAGLIKIQDKAVFEAIANMYEDFRTSVVKNQDSIIFENMLRQVRNNKKINLTNAGTLYNYVYKSLDTAEEDTFLAAKSINPTIDPVDFYASQVLIEKEWLVIKEWLEVYFAVTIHSLEFIEISHKTKKEIEDTLIEKYQNSKQWEIDSLKQLELQENEEAQQNNNEAISHPDYPQDFS